VLGMMTTELVRQEGNRPPSHQKTRKKHKDVGTTKDQLKTTIAQHKELLQIFKAYQARQLKDRMAYKAL